MGKFVIITLLVFAFAAIVYLTIFNTRNTSNNYNSPTMLLTSPSFKNGEYIPKKFSCDGSTSLTAGGGEINPELQIQNVPNGAKSLALILHDPDAPIAGGFTHWLVWNIDPQTVTIKEESVPPGSIEGKNDGGKYGYVGPCPPPGNPHHYHFKLYVLDAVLELPKEATKADLEAEIGKHVLVETDLVGLYKR